MHLCIYVNRQQTPAVNKKYNLGPEQGEVKVSVGEMETYLQVRQKEFRSVQEKQPMTKNFVEMCNALAPGLCSVKD